MLRVIVAAEESRRLGLTATPLELSGDDWEPLLRRTLRGPARFDHCAAAAQGALAARGLQDAARQLRTLLHHEATHTIPRRELDLVCAAAENMTRKLKPHVTRRRRSDDPFHVEFRRRLQSVRTDADVSHARAHRHIKPVVIELGGGPGSNETSETDQIWTRILFAMESIGQALLGFVKRSDDESGDQALSRYFETAYTRLSAGHLAERGRDELTALVENVSADELTDAQRRHRDRIAYWVGEQKRALAELTALEEREHGKAGDPLWSHPRVRCAIDVVESFTNVGEKVLVFGTYRAPMRALAQLLEVRHALRSLAANRPVPVAIGSSGPVAWRELTNMRRRGFDPGRALGDTQKQLQERWERAGRTYQNLYDQVRRRVRKELPRWLEARGIELSEFIGSAREKLERIAMPFIVDTLLYDEPVSVSDDKAERIAAAWTTLWSETIDPLMNDERERDDGALGGVSATDRLSNVLARLDDDAEKSHDTHYVRELHGQTAPSTRELLQARFNRRSAAPHVLVAQSRVGREGLNLHQACRVVVQFNAEWNPAILEQQIGRVDRKDSLWERLARQWMDSGDPNIAPVFIEVRQIFFAGTYDAFQWETVTSRQHLFDATLYGELLPAEKLANLDAATRARLAEAAPDFRPTERTCEHDAQART